MKTQYPPKARKNGVAKKPGVGMNDRICAALKDGPMTFDALWQVIGGERKAMRSAVQQMLARTGGVVEVLHKGIKHYALPKKREEPLKMPKMKPLKRDPFAHQELAMAVRR